MAKDARMVRDPHQKEIVKLFSAFDGSKNRRKIFDDFLVMTACMLSNTADPIHYDEREKLYMQFAGQYKKNELDIFARMIAEIVNGLEDNPDQDFLGEMYMALDFGSAAAGQFFTPYSVCRCTAALVSDYKVLESKIADQGFVSVTDPACGAGALLVAFCNSCIQHGINPQTQCLVIAQDIDFTVGCMCYIMMSFMGLAGYVVIGDTLCHPNTTRDRRGLIPVDDCSRIWYTPMFMSSDLWVGRRMAAAMDLMLSGGMISPAERTEPVTVEAPPRPLQSPPVAVTVESPVVISPEPEKPVEAEETAYGDNEFGQLMFF